jgi:hypothetical protein
MLSSIFFFFFGILCLIWKHELCREINSTHYVKFWKLKQIINMKLSYLKKNRFRIFWKILTVSSKKSDDFYQPRIHISGNCVWLMTRFVPCQGTKRNGQNNLRLKKNYLFLVPLDYFGIFSKLFISKDHNRYFLNVGKSGVTQDKKIIFPISLKLYIIFENK